MEPNPWYVLATVYGEQDGETVDEALHNRNRRIWNGWACAAMSADEKTEVAQKARIDPAQLAGWTPEEEEFVSAKFKRKNCGLPCNNTNINFAGLQINSLHMSGFVFPIGASFSSSYFFSGLSIANAVFLGSAMFDNTNIKGLNITETYVQEALSFINSDINGAYFSDSVFKGRVEFFQSSLVGSILFHGVSFYHDCMFSKVSVSERPNERNSLTFKECEFKSRLIMTDLFCELATEFRSCEFKQDLFCGADFMGDIPLQTRFMGNIAFLDCTFSEEVDFDFAIFSSGISFRKNRFLGHTYFTKVEFCSTVYFTDCNFERSTYFSDAKFVNYYPNFLGTILHQNTTFTAKSQFWPRTADAPAEESRQSLAIIRHAVGKQGFPEDEHYFFRREMAFAARIGTPLQRFPYQAFGALSDFGYSLAKPTVWLAGVWFIGFIAYSYWLTWLAPTLADAHPIFTAAGFSVAQLFGFLGFTGSYFRADFLDSLPSALKVLAGLQTVAGVVLLFFLGLGLRNRFRLK